MKYADEIYGKDPKRILIPAFLEFKKPWKEKRSGEQEDTRIMTERDFTKAIFKKINSVFAAHN